MSRNNGGPKYSALILKGMKNMDRSPEDVMETKAHAHIFCLVLQYTIPNSTFLSEQRRRCYVNKEILWEIESDISERRFWEMLPVLEIETLVIHSSGADSIIA